MSIEIRRDNVLLYGDEPSPFVIKKAEEMRMTSLTTFYLSRLIGCEIYDARENILGKIVDVYVRIPVMASDSDESLRPQVVGFSVRVDGKKKNAVLNDLQIVKFGIRYKVQCQTM